MKYRILVGAVASVALFASAAAAQVCQGDLSFRGRPMHVGGALGITDHTTTFGGGMTFGHAQGFYGGGSLGMMDFENAGSSLALSGGVGYSMPLQQRSRWQLCPGATLSFGFGPDQDLPGGNTLDMSSRTMSLGASIGTATALNKSVTLLPFGSLALANTSVSASSGGVSNSVDDTYMLLGFGAGFQFSPSLVLRPALSFAIGNDLIDDTVFSLGVTWALPGHGSRR